MSKKNQDEIKTEDVVVTTGFDYNEDTMANIDWDKVGEEVVADKKSKKEDDRIWKPNFKEANIYELYLLPDMSNGKVKAMDGFKTHTIKYFDGTKQQTVFGTCTKTVGQTCKICDHGWGIYNDKNSSKLVKDEAKQFLPTESEFCNIYVIKDPNNPENNGKVFLYKLTKAIKDIIKERLKPEAKNLSDDEFVAFNPFNPLKTAKLKLDVSLDVKNDNKTANADKTPKCNYQKSKFKISSIGELAPIAETPELRKAILSQTHSLTDFIAETTANNLLTDERINKTLIGKIISGEVSVDTTNTISNGVGNVTQTGEAVLSEEEKAFLENMTK